MAGRANLVNNGGLESVGGQGTAAAGSMVANTFTNVYAQNSQSNGVSAAVSITVTANGHAVERGGDLGLWDTVSGVAVSTDKCTYNTGGTPLSANYPNT